mmetsp:Transcript_84162/g.187901  ORF Transcript_84162/g.187901 Transcript_84162/m.187901 type:complete len:295 (+) Transcript_84162:206-1090(+)
MSSLAPAVSDSSSVSLVAGTSGSASLAAVSGAGVGVASGATAAALGGSCCAGASRFSCCAGAFSVAAGTAAAASWALELSPAAAGAVPSGALPARSASGRRSSKSLPCSFRRAMELLRVASLARVLASGWSRRHTIFLRVRFVAYMAVNATRVRSLLPSNGIPMRSNCTIPVFLAKPLAKAMAPSSLRAVFWERSISVMVEFLASMSPSMAAPASSMPQSLSFTTVTLVLLFKASDSSWIFSTDFIWKTAWLLKSMDSNLLSFSATLAMICDTLGWPKRAMASPSGPCPCWSRN